MAEAPETQNKERFDLQRYLDIVRRRHMHFLIPAFLAWVVVWASSWVLPARYKSSTLILVEQPTMPKNYVTPNVSDDLQDRLQSITQQILSRTRLLFIIDKLHLYADGHHQLTPDEKVVQMRKDIDIELVHDAHNDQITAFRVYYSAHDPHMAQQVTSELTGLFINENMKERQQESQDTTTFIANELEVARRTLHEQEEKVSEFQTAHEGELPSQQASNLQILSGLQSQLQNEQGALNTARQERAYFQTLIEQYRALHGTAPVTGGAVTGLAAIDQQLDKLKSKLAELRAQYTEKHPDVVSLQAEIAKTERMREEFIADPKNKASAGKQNADASAGGDPAQTAPLLQLQGQLQANQLEIANREQAVTDLKNRINHYQGLLNDEPAREQQLADLNRGYEQSKANYDDLLKKKEDSERATKLEEMQQGERFSMLDPPSLPLKPDFPNRLKFCGIGLGAALVLGLSVAGAFEGLDDRLHGDEEMKAILSMPVVSEIPEVLTPSDERSIKKRMVLGWTMAAFVIATILAGSAISYLRG
jgi:polysaccharide chain length determinant protein (PEP-CTERM system associated)